MLFSPVKVSRRCLVPALMKSSALPLELTKELLLDSETMLLSPFDGHAVEYY